MNDQTKADPVRPRSQQKVRLVDADVHPTMVSPEDAIPYLPSKWHDFHRTFAGFSKSPMVALDVYAGIEPNIARRDSYPPNGKPPGSDLPFMREQHLDANDIEYAMLQPLSPNGNWQRDVEYGVALCEAVNRWQIAEWTEPEPRLKASITVTQDLPEEAAREIRAKGAIKDYAQVILCQRSVEPLGRKTHWPIYAAAVEMGLPIGIHVGGNAGTPVFGAAGWASYHIQQHQGIHAGMCALMGSMIFEGVFDEFPQLRVVMVEGGFSWIPSALFRLDRIWEKMRGELLRVKRRPSEIFADHFWASTQPLDVFDNPKDLKQIIDWIGWEKLLFATDYPHWDSDDPRYAFPFALSAEERTKIFNANAKSVLRLGDGGAA